MTTQLNQTCHHVFDGQVYLVKVVGHVRVRLSSCPDGRHRRTQTVSVVAVVVVERGVKRPSERRIARKEAKLVVATSFRQQRMQRTQRTDRTQVSAAQIG